MRRVDRSHAASAEWLLRATAACERAEDALAESRRITQGRPDPRTRSAVRQQPMGPTDAGPVASD